jgi:8-oxo-dGTP pyrophosphatase MutT (NUDIX family)
MTEICFAQKAFIVSGRTLLLVRKSLHDPNHPCKWEVPGGRIHFGEDLDEHIKREGAEEVGIEVLPGPPFHVWQWRSQSRSSDGRLTDVQVIAVARLCTPLSLAVSARGQVDDDYLDSAVWVGFGELERYDFIPNMRPVIESFLKCVASNRSMIAGA